MTPGEIEALQALAEQHGRSLTINPQTGLPEAGWLGDILKVGATAAAVYYGGPLLGGALAPTSSVALQTGLGMGLVSGGITTLSTGSLKQGLGAGLTTGLIGGAMSGLNAPNPTANVATATPALEASKAAALQLPGNTVVNTGLNQAGTSMMTNPSIISAGASPVAQAAAAPSGGLFNTISNLSGKEKLGYGIAGVAGLGMLGDALAPKYKTPELDKGSVRPYTYQANMIAPSSSAPSPYPAGPMYNAAGNPILAQNEQRYFNQGYAALPAYKAADGGLMASGGVSTFPQSQQYTNDYATSLRNPMGNEVIDSGYEQRVGQYTGEPIGYAGGGIAFPQANNQQYSYNPDTQQYSQQNPSLQSLAGLSGYDNNSMGNINQVNPGVFRGLIDLLKNQSGIGQQGYTYDPVSQQYTRMANGGMTDLGDYSDGGRLLRGPGDGVSDSIPASIGGKQPARLADGEFVIPARIVSELGNGSTDAGAKRLYAMMDKIQAGRKKTVGKGKVAVDSKAAKHLPR
jgi:hypothetical protein